MGALEAGTVAGALAGAVLVAAALLMMWERGW